MLDVAQPIDITTVSQQTSGIGSKWISYALQNILYRFYIISSVYS